MMPYIISYRVPKQTNKNKNIKHTNIHGSINLLWPHADLLNVILLYHSFLMLFLLMMMQLNYRF